MASRATTLQSIRFQCVISQTGFVLTFKGLFRGWETFEVAPFLRPVAQLSRTIYHLHSPRVFLNPNTSDPLTLSDLQSHEECEGSKTTYCAPAFFGNCGVALSVCCCLGPPYGVVCGLLRRVCGVRRHGSCWTRTPFFFETRGG